MNNFTKGSENQARKEILKMVEDYWACYHQEKPGETTRIPYAARVYDHKEMVNLVDSALDFWLTAGRYSDQFEERFARFLGLPFCALVNSGSSANLLAFMALTSPLLGEKAIKKGDEVITTACGFPTTITPILQFGAVPVFVDVTIPQYNMDVSMLEAAVSEKTRAVLAAHTLGNPFDLQAVRDFCRKHDLWLIEDNCDALGSKVSLDGKLQMTGTAGHFGTSSFYPPHHMTMGEGGAVYTSDPLLHKIVRSLRDWGRDCVCPSGCDNLCGHRFDRQYGQLPLGYDHKYVYSHLGYNLKATDLQAAVGCAQLEKLPAFVEKRGKNFQCLKEMLLPVADRLILPEALPGSVPSWFGFPVTCRPGISRNAIVRHLEEKGIQTRMLFAGNLIKHPCFDGLREEQSAYRTVRALINTDTVMHDTFWVGVYPGLSLEQLTVMACAIKEAAAWSG